MMKPIAFSLLCSAAIAAEPVSVSGIYPQLATFNQHGECGTGAVVPWADRLWVISYAPHMPFGSTDKLYEITPDMKQIVRPESVGGTPANRMIHRETNQLLIGPYVIDAQRKVRVIPPNKMPGRLTGNARSLTDAAGHAYYATMEEGLYDVDLKTLEVTGLIKDGNAPKKGFSQETKPATIASELPGYHGKGLYSGQGYVVYANNGDHDKRVLTDPSTPSGALGTWQKPGDDWKLVRRNQFTEVTGPGGIFGNEHPDKDPIWSIGWDHRSLILMLLDGGKWQAFRLPKASHAYDGAHGWNTEWPRIRDIGEGDDLLMTMHGMFWHFPKSFSAANTTGIAPRSTYLKIVGDFCRWGDRVVLGCDDTAQSEFLNKSKLKGALAGPGQSQSNLRFIKSEQLDQFGPPLGRGAVWMNDALKAGEWSDPYLFSGFARRGVFLVHDAKDAVAVSFEVNNGDGKWTQLRTVNVAAGGGHWESFGSGDSGTWVRLKSDKDVHSMTAMFHYSAEDKRSSSADPMFAGIASAGAKEIIGGLLLTRGKDLRTLSVATSDNFYELTADLKLVHRDDAKALEYMKKNAAIPVGVVTTDAASVVIVDEKGKRWRLPKSADAGSVPQRVDREVCTERDLVNVGGTFYELPANNAGGMAKIRPIATHNRCIQDYCSYRGLLVMTGIAPDAAANPQILRSDDGKAAVWAGAVDDLWSLGKPRGQGGPWAGTNVRKDSPSDPYLFMGYDKKSIALTHSATQAVTFRIEVDITGTGNWVRYKSIVVKPGETASEVFPDGYQAYWLRTLADQDCKATAQLVYE